MSKLDEVYESITGSISLVPYKRSIVQVILSKLSKVFGREPEFQRISQ